MGRQVLCWVPMEAFKTMSPPQPPGSPADGTGRITEPGDDLPLCPTGRSWEWTTCGYLAATEPCIAELCVQKTRREEGAGARGTPSHIPHLWRYGCTPAYDPTAAGWLLHVGTQAPLLQTRDPSPVYGTNRVKRAGRKEWDRVPAVHDKGAAVPVPR